MMINKDVCTVKRLYTLSLSLLSLMTILLHNRAFFTQYSLTANDSTLWANNKQHNWVWTRADPCPWIEKWNRDPSPLGKKTVPCFVSLVSWPRPHLSRYGPTLADLWVTGIQSCKSGHWRTSHPYKISRAMQPTGTTGDTQDFPSVTKMSWQDVWNWQGKQADVHLLQPKKWFLDWIQDPNLQEGVIPDNAKGDVPSQPILIGAMPACFSPSSIAASLEVQTRCPQNSPQAIRKGGCFFIYVLLHCNAARAPVLGLSISHPSITHQLIDSSLLSFRKHSINHWETNYTSPKFS